MVAALIDLKSVEDEIHCPVCKGEIRQCWYLRHCLHRFCHDCFLRSLRNDVRSCPVCRVRVASKRDAEADPRFDRLIEVLTRLGRGADDSSGDDEVDIASIMRQQQERAAALRKEAARLAARPWVPSQAAQAHAAAAGHLPEAGRKTMPLGRKAEPWRRDRQESEAPEEEVRDEGGGEEAEGEGEEEDEEEQETSACSSQQDAGQVEDEGDEEYEPEPWQRHMVGRNASRMAAAAMPPLHATGSPSARGVKPGAAVFLPPVLSSGDSGGACSPQRHSGGGARKPKRSSDAAVPAAGGSRLAKRSRAGFPADGEAGGGSPLRHGLDCNGNSAEGQREADGSMPNTTPLQAVQAVRILKQISRRLEADEPWPGQVVLHLVPAPAPPPPQPPATTGQLEDAAEAAIPQPAFQQLPPIPHPYLICPLQMRFESLIGLLMKSFPREAIQRVNRAGGRAQIQLLLGNAVPASQYRDALPMTTTLLQAEGHCYPTQPHMVVHYRLQPLAAV